MISYRYKIKEKPFFFLVMSTLRIEYVNDFNFLKGTWFKALQLLILMSLHTHTPFTTPTHSDHLWNKEFF